MRDRIFPLAIILSFTTICFAALQSPLSTTANLASASQQVQDHVQKQVPKACPITKPPARPFVPPPPYGTDHGPDQFWYGTESLWTLLGVDGTWNIHNNVLESQGSYRTKLTYWGRGFDWRRELKPELTVIAKRLYRQAPPVAAEQANAVYIAGPGMMTAIDIPSSGCWEIKARYSGDSLSFVVSVEP